MDLDARVQRLELEYTHLRETMGLRFDSAAGQTQLISAKLDKIAGEIGRTMSDPAMSASGRALRTEITINEQRIAALATERHKDHEQIAILQAALDQANGAILTLRFLVGAGVLTALLAFGVAVFRMAAGH